MMYSTPITKYFNAISRYDTSLADACAALAKKWSEATDDDLAKLTAEDTKDFSSFQMREFLSQLLEEVIYLLCYFIQLIYFKCLCVYKCYMLCTTEIGWQLYIFF